MDPRAYVDLDTLNREQLLLMHSNTVQFLQELRLYINDLPPINRLPIELLVEVFKHASRFPGPALGSRSHTKKDKDGTQPLPLVLVTITHVCRLWREVAIGAAVLWRHIHSMKNDSLLQLYLARSSTALLTADLVVKNTGRKALENILRSCGARLHTLHVHDITSTMSRNAPLYLRSISRASVATTLQCCTITFARGSERLWRSFEDSPRPHLFGERILGLHALSLRPVPNWLPGNDFPQLTHLSLGFSGHCGSTLLQYLRGLLTMFARTPRLAYVRLKDIATSPGSPGVFTDDPKREEPAKLSQLRHLCIQDSDMRTVLTFLNSLITPVHCLVELECTEKSYIGQLDPLLFKLPDLRVMSSLTHLELSAMKRHLHIVAGRRDSLRTGFSLHAEIGAGNATKDWNTWLAALPAMFPVSSLTRIHICLPDGDFVNLLRRMTSLVDLRVLLPDAAKTIWEPCLKNLCAALGDESRPACPRLATFGLQTHILPGEMYSYSRIMDMAAIREYLGRRLRLIIVQASMPLPWRPWTGDNAIEELFAHVFSGLERYVDQVEYHGPDEESICDFGLDEDWDVADAEKYWPLQSSPSDPESMNSQPRRTLPWMVA